MASATEGLYIDKYCNCDIFHLLCNARALILSGVSQGTKNEYDRFACAMHEQGAAERWQVFIFGGRTMKIFKVLILALAATLVGSGAYACGTSACNPPPPTTTCGNNGCYLTTGNMWVNGANLSTAWGDKATTMAGIQYNLTANLGKNEFGTLDGVALTGGFLAGSDGTGLVKSSGTVDGWASWSTSWKW